MEARLDWPHNATVNHQLVDLRFNPEMAWGQVTAVNRLGQRAGSIHRSPRIKRATTQCDGLKYPFQHKVSAAYEKSVQNQRALIVLPREGPFCDLRLSPNKRPFCVLRGDGDLAYVGHVAYSSISKRIVDLHCSDRSNGGKLCHQPVAASSDRGHRLRRSRGGLSEDPTIIGPCANG